MPNTLYKAGVKDGIAYTLKQIELNKLPNDGMIYLTKETYNKLKEELLGINNNEDDN